MNRDPAAFGADADAFRPERHIDARGALIRGMLDSQEDNHAAFGFGRRCAPPSPPLTPVG